MNDETNNSFLAEKTKRHIKLSELARNLNADVLNLQNDPIVKGFATLDTATKDDISFIISRKFAKHAQKSSAAAFISPKNITVPDRPTLCVDNVWEALLFVLNYFYQSKKYPPEIHPNAKIGKDVEIGTGTFVGAFCVILDGTQIGSNCIIRESCYLANNVKIGNNCTLFPHVTVLDRVEVGNRVILHPGVVLGSDGYKYEMIRNKRTKIPQIGTVVIEDDVEIGANSCVDRASFDETRIGAGTKIDNLVHIAHNVKIGHNCLIIAQVGIAGSTEIGDNVVLAGQVGLKDNIKLGNNVIIGAQSGVHADIDDGSVFFGTPAFPMELFRKCWVHFKHLPEMNKKIKDFEKRIEELINKK